MICIPALWPMIYRGSSRVQARVWVRYMGTGTVMGTDMEMGMGTDMEMGMGRGMGMGTGTG